MHPGGLVNCNIELTPPVDIVCEIIGLTGGFTVVFISTPFIGCVQVTMLKLQQQALGSDALVQS